MYKEIILRPTSSEFYPSFIPVRLTKKPIPYSRMGEMVDLFKERIEAIKSEEFNQNNISQYTGLYRFFGTEYYCFTFDKNSGVLAEYVFEKVDTSRPWTITKNSEGGEHIHYFDDNERYEITDKDLNYGVYK